MNILTNGYLQDGLKLFIYLVPLIYILKKHNALGLKYFWIILAGLIFLAFGQMLDFLDEFEAIRRLFPGKPMQYLQDFFEDSVGMTLGFALFSAGLYLEFIRKRR